MAAGPLQIKDIILGTYSPWHLVRFVHVLSSLVVILSAVVAGVIFRPDNTEVLQMVHPHHVKYARRVEIHAAANAGILIMALVRVFLAAVGFGT